MNKFIYTTLMLSVSTSCFCAEKEEAPCMPSSMSNRQVAITPDFPEINRTYLKGLGWEDLRAMFFMLTFDEFPEINRKHAGYYALQFITPDMSHEEIKSILTTFYRIPVNECNQEFMEQANQFLATDPALKVLKKMKIITAFSKVPTHDRNQAFIDQIKQLFPQNASGEIIGGLGRVAPTKDLGDVIANTITIISSIPLSGRQTFIDQVRQFIGGEKNSYDIEEIMNAWSKVKPEDQNQIFIDQLKRVIGAMTINSRAWAITILSKIPADIRSELITQVQQLRNHYLPGASKVECINLLSTIPTNVRTEFINQVNQLINPYMKAGEIKDIMKHLSKIPADERPLYVARTLLFVYGTGNLGHLRHLLETPLQQEFMIGGMHELAQGVRNPYAAGINVHAGQRDNFTIEAIKTFTDTVQTTPEELDIAYAEFLNAVNQLDGQKRDKVLRSLGIDANGTILEKPPTEFWSGLISGVNESGIFSLAANGKSIAMNGKDIIARFWHFANTFDESVVDSSKLSVDKKISAHTQNDRDGMRQGIMNALAEGVTETNVLRCEMGRIQLLILATLQGRLRDNTGQVIDLDRKETQQAAREVQQDDELIYNLNEISLHLNPFMNSLQGIHSAKDFYQELFGYMSRLAAGEVNADNTPIRLDPASVIYYVTMISPAVYEKGKLLTPATINPDFSLVHTQNFTDAFRIDDYIRQFGQRDQERFEAARALEAARQLRTEQDIAFEETKQQDQHRFNERAKQAEQLQQLRTAIADGTARGLKTIPQNIFNQLTMEERTAYAQQRQPALAEQNSTSQVGPSAASDNASVNQLSDQEKMRQARLKQFDTKPSAEKS